MDEPILNLKKEIERLINKSGTVDFIFLLKDLEEKKKEIECPYTKGFCDAICGALEVLEKKEKEEKEEEVDIKKIEKIEEEYFLLRRKILMRYKQIIDNHVEAKKS